MCCAPIERSSELEHRRHKVSVNLRNGELLADLIYAGDRLVADCALLDRAEGEERREEAVRIGDAADKFNKGAQHLGNRDIHLVRKLVLRTRTRQL